MPRAIGQPLKRFEDVRFITGTGRYTDDLAPRDAAVGAFVRSPYAHARLRSIDTAAALAAPGVIAVLTAADYLADGHGPLADAPVPADAVDHRKPAFENGPAGRLTIVRELPLAHERVRYVGQAVAMVVGESAAAARDGAALVEVAYDELPAVADVRDGRAPGAAQLWDEVPGNVVLDQRFGDAAGVDDALARADLTVEHEFVNQRIVAAQMEPHATFARGTADGERVELVTGGQGVVRQRAVLAETLRIAPEALEVVTPDTGGSFGIRQFLHAEDVLVVWAARRLHRTVRWTADRSEDMLASYQGRDIVVRATAGFARDGALTALRLEVLGNQGASSVYFAPVQNYLRIATTVYDVPFADVRLLGVLTNTVPTVPYRGAGRPEATFTIERLLDIAARRLGIDRVAIRRRNLIRREQLPYTTAVGLTYDSGDFVGNMDAVLQRAAWSTFEARRRTSEARGMLRGIGVANYVEAPVGAPRERIVLRVDGARRRVELVVGTQSSGQGHETAFAQVIADLLDVPLETVALVTGDTRLVAVGGGSHSNRSMRLVGTLLFEACADLRQRANGGDVFAAAAASESGVLEAQADFYGRIPAHPTGSAVCEVEIDPHTGATRVVAYTQIDDVGQAINPLIVEGQTHGGIAQGLGQAFWERLDVDRETAQVVGASFMQYALPRAEDLPSFEIGLAEDPTAGNPLRIKGGGEGGVTPSPAAAINAVIDALRATGIEDIEQPATPERIWKVLQAARPLQV